MGKQIPTSQEHHGGEKGEGKGEAKTDPNVDKTEAGTTNSDSRRRKGIVTGKEKE